MFRVRTPAARAASTIAAIVCASSLAQHARAATTYLPIFAGAGSAGEPGDYTAWRIPIDASRSVANGFGLGEARLLADDFGYARGVRWDTHGNVEILGASTDGEPETGFTTTANAINASGTVAGNVSGTAVRWVPGSTKAMPLAPLNAAYTEGDSDAYDINNAGVVVGESAAWDADGNYVGSRGVRWSAAGVPTALQPAAIFADGKTAYASGVSINDAGAVVGFDQSPDASGHFNEQPLRWAANSTTPTVLKMLTPPTGGQASGRAALINAAGAATGITQLFDATGSFIGEHSMRWTADSVDPMELQSLGNDATDDTYASSINSSGVVVGVCLQTGPTASQFLTAVRWDASSGVPIALAGLGATTVASNAFSVNDAGQAVGGIQTHDANGDVAHAVFWNSDGSVLDLNTLIDPTSGWHLDTAVSINNAGWITGLGTFDPDGSGPDEAYSRMFLIQIPEPSCLASLGVAPLLLRRRRSR